MNFIKKNILFTGLFLLGIFYVLVNVWSPSSYGLVLEALGYIDMGPDFGIPRIIRSDEWAVQTPLTQALVHNDFSRFNLTSVYEEDLRFNYGLPIFDWGMLFKPALWGYFFLPPAYAFSLYYYTLSMFFIVGYMFLLEKLGSNRVVAFLFSCALYYSGAIQFWWGVNASTFAYFPWVAISFIAIYSKKRSAFFFFYFLVSWQLGSFYPPFTYAFGLAGIVYVNIFFLSNNYKFFNPKVLILAFIMLVYASLVVIIYYYDYILNLKDTLYPGSRDVMGGLEYWEKYFLTFIAPTLIFSSNYDVINPNIGNISNSSTWATLLPFAMFFFIKIKNNVVRIDKVLIIKILPTILILTIILVWLLFPVPRELGKYLFLNKIMPNRLMLSLGLIISLLSFIVFIKSQFIITIPRYLLFIGVYLVVILAYKSSWEAVKVDILGIAVASIITVVLAYRRMDHKTILISFVSVYSLICFGYFNPLQNSKYIFQPLINEKLNKLTLEANINGFIHDGTMMGAVLNGLGYKSISHVTPTPQLSFWRRKFPNLSENELLNVFSRYAHIQVQDINEIRVVSTDLVFVPRRCFNFNFDTPCLDVNAIDMNGLQLSQLKGLKYGGLTAVNYSGIEFFKNIHPFLNSDFVNIVFREFLPVQRINSTKHTVLKKTYAVGTSPDTLILERIKTNNLMDISKWTKTVEYHESTILNVSKNLIFAKIDMKQNIVQKVLSYMLTNNSIKISIQLNNGTTKSYYVDQKFIQSSFLISHLYENINEFILLFSDNYFDYEPNKVVSIQITPSYPLMWAKNYQIFFKESALNKRINSKLFFNIKQVKEKTPQYIDQCSGSIDNMNRTGSLFSMNGWLAVSTEQYIPTEQNIAVFTDESNNIYSFIMQKKYRPDVAQAYATKELEYSGFSFDLTMPSLPKGKYMINLGYIYKGYTYICHAPLAEELFF